MNWPDGWEAQMWAVHGEVNQLPYVGDANKYKLDDFWKSIDEAGSGDCEDYAIAKLRRLVVQGWPVEALHLACCYTEPPREYHAVLVVDTPTGNAYLLDNRLDAPVDVGKLQELDYQPDIIQAVGGQKAWREWKFSE